VFHAAVDTNNGTESQNKVLKYSYMPRKKNTSLSSIAATLIENFLPDSYRTYQMKNYMMSDQYWPYKTFVPTYLHNRPKAVILHCLDQKKKSTKYTEEDVDGDHGKFTVKKPSGSVHNVDFGTSTGVPSCTCKDWARSNLPCKHFFAVFRFSKNWNWESLPQAYLNGPYLMLDYNHLDCGHHFLAPTIPDVPAEDDCSRPGLGALTPSQHTDNPDSSAEDSIPPKVNKHVVKYLIVCC